MMKSILVASLLFVTLLFGFSGKPSEFFLREFAFARCGGFAGIFEGYVIDSVGNLYHCGGQKTCQKDSLIKKLNKKQFAKIIDVITKNLLLNKNYKNPSRVCGYFRISTKDSTNIIYWNLLAEDSLSTSLNSILHELNEIIK